MLLTFFARLLYIFACHNSSRIIMGHHKKSFVKKSIEKANYPKCSINRPLKACYCNSCNGKLVNPRTKKAYISKVNITGITRNYRNFSESSSKVTVVSTIAFPIMDIPEELSEMDIYEEPMHIDSSDNDSVSSFYKDDFSFITKSQSKKKRNLSEAEEKRINKALFSKRIYSQMKKLS